MVTPTIDDLYHRLEESDKAQDEELKKEKEKEVIERKKYGEKGWDGLTDEEKHEALREAIRIMEARKGKKEKNGVYEKTIETKAN